LGSLAQRRLLPTLVGHVQVEIEKAAIVLQILDEQLVGQAALKLLKSGPRAGSTCSSSSTREPRCGSSAMASAKAWIGFSAAFRR
jgi:hypothetical protein